MAKQDIFKLVQEVENQKKASLDDIYKMLDNNTKNNNTDTIEEVRSKVNASASLSSLNIKTHNYSSSKVSVPTFPLQVTFDTRFDCFKALIEGVNYGNENSEEYVMAHKQALEDVYQDAYNNMNDLYVIEARVNDEINRTISKNTIREKGYYDGLMYALKAIRKSKTLTMNKVKQILMNSLS